MPGRGVARPVSRWPVRSPRRRPCRGTRCSGDIEPIEPGVVLPDGDGEGVRRPPSWKPVLFLLVCAPTVVDVLFGATQLSSIVALVPEVFTYGCAALLIRGFARDRNAGWATVVLWGLAFALITECLIVQTSLAPLTGPDPRWGRALGVNWPYLVWALGYESGWAIALSIELTHLVLPAYRDRKWPGRRGRRILIAVFVLGAIPTGYNWTHRVAPRLSHRPVYQPPLLTLLVATVVAGLLVILGMRLVRHRSRHQARWRPTRTRQVARPVTAAATAFIAAALWFGLLLPGINGRVDAVPVVLAIVLAVLVAIVFLLLVHRWSHASGWDGRHRLALVIGGLSASMAAGYLANHFTTVDLIAKFVLNGAALAGLGVLYRRNAHGIEDCATTGKSRAH